LDPGEGVSSSIHGGVFLWFCSFRDDGFGFPLAAVAVGFVPGSRPYAYNLIGSARVNEQMSSIEDIRVKPQNEAQFRELISVPEEKRVEAWKGAIKLAGEEPVTATIVHRAAAKFKPEKPGKPTAKKKPSGKRINLGPALKLLARAEQAANVSKDKVVLKELSALRKCLEALAGQKP
jgi:hypothetical protein